MSLSCDSGDFDSDGCDWWWLWNRDSKPLATKRSRKCCSCGSKIMVGDTTSMIERYRPPSSDIEESINGDEVAMAPWFLCETCGDLALSLDELGFCFELGTDSLKDQIKEYRDMELEEKTHSYASVISQNK
jgi:hypothetical protein